MKVWRQSGMEISRISAQVIAIRMMITDHQKRKNGLILISAYAPIGVDSDEAWTSFFDDYDAAVLAFLVVGDHHADGIYSV